MPNVCTICTHPQRLEIDKKIVSGGSTLAEIAKFYSIQSYHALWNHAQLHISRSLAKAAEKSMMIENNELMDIITRILKRTEDIFVRNYDNKRDLLALKALDSQRNTIQLLSNISAQVHAAKMCEIELARKNSGEEEEQRKLKYQEDLKVLTFDELEVYERFVNKLLHHNADIIVKDGRVMAHNRYPKPE